MGQQQLPKPCWQDPPEPLSQRPHSSVSALRIIPKCCRFWLRGGDPLREVRERGQGSGFAVGNFPWAGGGKHGLVPGAGTNVSVPWKGQAGEENLCLGSDECPLPSASNLICADCM